MARGAVLLSTIGYEGRTPEELVAILKHGGVTRVIDVRQMPLSRKPGFSKTALAEFLRARGIEYVGVPRLGTPPAIRDRYKKGGNFARLRRDYVAYLAGQKPAVAELRALAAQGGCVLLCFERDPQQCHRSILADMLVGGAGAQLEVRHLGQTPAPGQGDLFEPVRRTTARERKRRR